ncbi:MAG: hypothetical protein ACP5E4_03105 [Candidatus Aenigmatarchaeota archaeon]
MGRRYSSSKRRGQALSVDFLVVMSTVIFLSTILLVYLGHKSSYTEELRASEEMMSEAEKIGDAFFYGGFPQDWTADNVESIGLQSGNRLDSSKLEEFGKLDYQKSIYLLGLRSDYNISLSINGSTEYSFGTPYEGKNASSILRLKRLGTLNGSLAFIEILVFR